MSYESVLKKMTGPELVALHNKHAPNPVRKFTDKDTAVARTAKRLAEAGIKAEDIANDEDGHIPGFAKNKKAAKDNHPTKSQQIKSGNGKRGKYSGNKIHLKKEKDDKYKNGKIAEDFKMLRDGMLRETFIANGGLQNSLRIFAIDGYVSLSD